MDDIDANQSSDDDGFEMLITSRRRDNGTRLNSTWRSSAHDTMMTEIITSMYSYTYKQTTGKLLSSRLSAMQRSLTSFKSSGLTDSNCYFNHDEAPNVQISSLLKRLNSFDSRDSRIFLPLDDQLRETNEQMLEFLAVPYIDLAPAHELPLEIPNRSRSSARTPSASRTPSAALRSSTLIRPPSLFRRASSMMFKPQELSVSHSATDLARGIATPLQHLPSKQTSCQALFTTTAERPYKIKTMNDAASFFIGTTLYPTQSLYLLDFVAPKFHEWLEEELNSSKTTKVRLCGELIELGEKLASVWVEAPDTGLFMWSIEEVLLADTKHTEETFNENLENLNQTNRKIHRIPTNSSEIILQGNKRLWAPMAIGCAILVDRQSLRIEGYNHQALSLMLGGHHDVKGLKFTDLVPQFDDFWSHICDNITVPGIVIPEHRIRQLAGISLMSPQYIAPNPSTDPEKSIKLVTEYGILFVDLQVRLIQDDILVIWLSYSRESKSDADLIPQIESVVAATPPHTPKITPLNTPSTTPKSTLIKSHLEEPAPEYWLEIEVGKNRRTKKFTDFQPIKVLGHGAYGEVRLAKASSGNHTIVLKSIYKDRILIDTWSRDRVLGTIPNEIRVLNQVRSTRHPNIVTMIDFFEDEKYYHIEMLPCGSPQAMDLFDFIEIRGEECSPTVLFDIWKQVASAVAHIHSLGIIHRDLKDENVIMDEHGCARLIDFGSTAYINQGPFDLFVGTIDYAAPEVISGEPYDGPPQDMWALGIILFTMLFRETPFKNADEIVVALYPDVESSLYDNVIRKLLSKSPAERPSADKLMAMSL